MSGRRLSGEAGGLPSPLTVLEQPPAFAEELPHHGGRARPRRRRRGSGETQPRGDDGSAGRPSCPPRPRRSEASRAAFTACRTARRKTRASNLPLPSITAREIATSRASRLDLVIRGSAASQAPSPQEPAPAARSAARESSNSQQLQDAPPRDPAGPAPRRAPEVDGRHDAPRRVDLEPREQVHWYETRRGRKAAFFSGLESDTPSIGSDAVAPKRRVESQAVVSRRLVRLPPLGERS